MDARIPTMTQTDPPPRTASAKSRVFPTLLLGAASLLVAACASTRIPSTTLTGSDPDAMSILTASQRAHGSEAFATIRDLNIRYASRWSTLGSRGHSVLWDQRYRRESEEALELGSGTIVQLHKGPGGRKFVLRAPGRVTVWYNGQPDSREDVLRAAALVADIEKMELLGPLYFQRPGVILEKIGSRGAFDRSRDAAAAACRDDARWPQARRQRDDGGDVPHLGAAQRRVVGGGLRRKHSRSHESERAARESRGVEGESRLRAAPSGNARRSAGRGCGAIALRA